MAKKYLVTGGTGFLGSAIVKSLLENGEEVRVLDNNFRGDNRKIASVAGLIDFIEADIRDSAKVKEAAKGIDVLVHLAFINGTEFFYSQPDLVLDVGVRGMLNVLDACKEQGVKELVLASSSEVYQTPAYVPTDEKVPLSIPDVLNPRYSYAGGKIISELLALNQKYLERVLVFRPHNIYGPDMGWEHVIPQFILQTIGLSKTTPEGQKIKFSIQGDGSQTRAFCYLDDFCAGFMIMLKKGQHLSVYNIGNPAEITIAELARKLVKHFGREADIVLGLALPAGGTLRRCPDISKLAALGFEPKISLEQGLALTVDWYANNLRLWPNRA